MSPASKLVFGRVVTVRRSVTVVALVAAWCALWQSVSVANVLSGFAIATVSIALGMGGGGRGGIRLRPLARFLWLVVVDLVVSTGAVARAVLTVGSRPDEGVVDGRGWRLPARRAQPSTRPGRRSPRWV